MNMMTLSRSIGEALYSKGIFGHVTVDLVSFPDPTSPQSHPLFWAVDLNCGMTDYATSCLFFDFLMVRNTLLIFYRVENWTNLQESILLIQQQYQELRIMAILKALMQMIAFLQHILLPLNLLKEVHLKT
jgi:hypothetical protein